MLALCEKKREPQLEYIIVDTPGQIEIFTWSASGAIITEAFGAGVLYWLLLKPVLSALLASCWLLAESCLGLWKRRTACVARLLCRACCAAPAVRSCASPCASRLLCRACCAALVRCSCVPRPLRRARCAALAQHD